jgi:hypothetical protein
LDREGVPVSRCALVQRRRGRGTRLVLALLTRGRFWRRRATASTVRVVMRRNTTLLWTLVAFLAGSVVFGALRRATEDSSTWVTVLVQVAALALVIGAVVLVARRLR